MRVCLAVRGRPFQCQGAHAPGRFVEVFVQADVETCRARDPKGLYARASTGGLDQFTGVSAPYEEPVAPELTIDTRVVSADAATEMVIDFLRRHRLIDV